ncbi:testis-expressed protein 26 [Callorhinchus milii]|uniref:testis-expressed protein 26 n=1 Tax=Callorhinchus milii TaxID=7868 RepID=UPI00045744C8|nr:testis-expressed protein 26 [Callorhinchus milii]|eukprot:gi/632983599/ref/XP_007908726.1/ PREDICTED: testis-expressed sequence 26 protein [Callorhinchus milii]
MESLNCIKTEDKRKNRAKEKQDCPRGLKHFDPHETTNRHDYVAHPYSRPTIFRTGCLTESKRNNPHPNKTFMIYHLHRKEHDKDHKIDDCWDKPLSEDEVFKRLSGDYCTMYRKEFPDKFKDFEMKPIIPRPPDWKKEVPHPLISEFRDKFRLPYINCELMVDTSRYGSNAHRDYPPKGITPNVTYAHVKNQEKRKKMTTYQTDYSNVYDGLASILKNMEPARINAHLCTVSKRDKALLQKFLKSVVSPCKTRPTASRIC